MIFICIRIKYIPQSEIAKCLATTMKPEIIATTKTTTKTTAAYDDDKHLNEKKSGHNKRINDDDNDEKIDESSASFSEDRNENLKTNKNLLRSSNFNCSSINATTMDLKRNSVAKMIQNDDDDDDNKVNRKKET